MEHHTIKVDRTAHYYTHGRLSKATRKIWFVFHGYGQQADLVLDKFSWMSEEEHFVIAPEALSRFYWHKNNKPVASWMTKRDRYDEIEDFVNYIDTLYTRYCSHVDHKVQINLFGFSQGCATMWRWVHARQPRFDTMINWAGSVPEDISYLHLDDYFSNKRLYTHVGDKDEFLHTEVIEKLKKLVTDNNLQVDFSLFEGKHHIPVDELKRYLQEVVGLKF